jgi:hypothetical protein
MSEWLDHDHSSSMTLETNHLPLYSSSAGSEEFLFGDVCSDGAEGPGKDVLGGGGVNNALKEGRNCVMIWLRLYLVLTWHCSTARIGTLPQYSGYV